MPPNSDGPTGPMNYVFFSDLISPSRNTVVQCRSADGALPAPVYVSSLAFDPPAALTKLTLLFVAASRNAVMSNSRNAYTALTPDYADFSIPHRVGTPSEQDPTGYEVDFEEEAKLSRWRAALGKAKTTVKNNVGLLLVAGSQAFFSMMNVAVKKLNTIDPPVSTLQVRRPLFFTDLQSHEVTHSISIIARRHSNGNSLLMLRLCLRLRQLC